MILLTISTHHLELQYITTLSLISTIYKSLHAKSFLTCSVFNSLFLATASNSGGSSASRAQVLSSQPPPQNSTLNCLRRPSCLPYSPFAGTEQETPFRTVAYVFIYVGACLPIRCLEICSITPSFVRLSRGHCKATDDVHATLLWRLSSSYPKSESNHKTNY
jgi:hypothetical protein